jgi:hypothetical protein
MVQVTAMAKTKKIGCSAKGTVAKDAPNKGEVVNEADIQFSGDTGPGTMHYKMSRE